MTDVNASTNGSGQSVSVVLPTASMWLLGTLIISLVICVAISVKAMERADDAYEASARAQRQADLANWTMNNLEGLMQQHGYYIPQAFQPKNLTRKEPKK